MTDANTICHDVDLLGDWLDARGYTEEAGLCLRVLGLIHEQAEEIEKLRTKNKELEKEANKLLVDMMWMKLCHDNERSYGSNIEGETE